VAINSGTTAGDDIRPAADIGVSPPGSAFEGGDLNLLVNGGFDRGDFSGWQTNFVPPDNAAVLFDLGTGRVHEGTHAVNFNYFDVPASAMLSQSLATSKDSRYELSFWFGATAVAGRAPSIIAEVLGAGNAVLSRRSFAIPGNGGTQYQFFSLPFVADGAQATIRFRDTTPDSSSADGLLDSVAVALASAGQLSIVATSADKTEGGQAGRKTFTFTVSRSGVIGTTHSVDWAVSGDVSAADFVGGALPAGRITFAPGETARTITINIVGDSLVERSEAFTVTLSKPSAGAVIGTAAANGVIRNDDRAGAPDLPDGPETRAIVTNGVAGPHASLKYRFSFDTDTAFNVTPSSWSYESWHIVQFEVRNATTGQLLGDGGVNKYFVNGTAGPGDYDLIVRNLGSGGLFRYSFDLTTITLPAAPVDLGTLDAQGRTRLPIAITDSFSVGNTEDRYTFTLQAQQTLSVTASVNQSNINYYPYINLTTGNGRIFSATEKRAAYNHDSFVYNLGPGTYALSLRGANGVNWQTFNTYDLKLFFGATPPGELFSNAGNSVDFANLSARQREAIAFGHQTVDALGGNDRVTLSTSYSTMRGGGGDDTITGSTAGDVIDGGIGNDILSGGRGDDILTAGAGSNRLDGGEGADVLDLRSGAESGLRAGTLQTVDGGSQPSGKRDIVLLPGAATDYAYAVSFAGMETTLRTAGVTGATVRLVDVELARFADPIENLVKPMDGSVAVEMALLAKEVYGPNPTLGHKAEKLGWEAGWKAGETREVANAAEQRGWHGMEAIEIGLKPGNPGDGSSLKWSFENGHYMAYGSDLFPGDTAEANALVLSGLVGSSSGEEKKTLAVVFRGTDQVADFIHYDNFARHYALFAPLIKSLRDYVADPENHVEQVLVSGHSLGAGMVEYFLREAMAAGVEVRGWTYGSPGSEARAAAGSIAYNLVHTHDPVPLASVATTTFLPIISEVLSRLAPPAAGVFLKAILGAIKPKPREGVDINLSSDIANWYLPMDEHAQTSYVADVRKLVKFANDPLSPFFRTREPFAEALVRGGTYAGPELKIAVGRPIDHESQYDERAVPAYYSTVTVHGDDAYVLGSDGNDTFTFFGSSKASGDPLDAAAIVRARGNRKLDGGMGIDDVFLPFAIGGMLELTALADGGTHLVWKLASGVDIGDVYRVEKLVGLDETVRLDGKVARVQTATASAATTSVAAAPATTPSLFQLRAGFDYADVGDGDYLVRGTDMDDVVYVGNGQGAIEGLGGADVIIMKPAQGIALGRVIDGGTGDDLMVGGGGDDRFVVDSSGDVVIDAAGGHDTVEATVSFEAPEGIEEVVLRGTAAIDAFGNGAANLLVGNAANNLLDGREGGDRMAGGSGDDVYIVDNAGDRVVEDARAGTDLVVSSVSFDLAGQAIEFLSLGGSANIAGTGNGLNNTIVGNAGSNALSGGDGADRLLGGGGKDTLDGGAGSDTADYGDKTGAVSVALAASEAARVRIDGVAEDTVRNIENVSGGAGNDTLAGDGLDNVLDGGAGDDTLKGGGSKDTLEGGAGSDTADYGDETRAVEVTLARATAASVKIGGTVEDTLRNIEILRGGSGNDVLGGDSLDNHLAGGAGDDVLTGGGGSDQLDGGLGRDSMTGGDGVDRFAFAAGESPTTRYDTITDFASGVDKIDLPTVAGTLAASGFAAVSIASNTFATLLGAASATMAGGDKAAVFVAGSQHGWLFWSTDGNNTTIEQAVRLNGANSLGAFDRTDLT
jgi:Ca2+-binding RTX toxin-like protein